MRSAFRRRVCSHAPENRLFIWPTTATTGQWRSKCWLATPTNWPSPAFPPAPWWPWWMRRRRTKSNEATYGDAGSGSGGAGRDCLGRATGDQSECLHGRGGTSVYQGQERSRYDHGGGARGVDGGQQRNAHRADERWRRHGDYPPPRSRSEERRVG